MRKFLSVIFAILVCQLAGLIGSIFTFSAIPTWYVFLNKPSFSPPNWIFGPVWTLLYTLMGIAAYIIWKRGAKNKTVRGALALFGFHLILNSLWSIIFFGAHALFPAFVEILILWSTIIILILKFYRIEKTAAYLLLPYLAWVSFASVLNFSVWFLNR